MAYRSKPAGYRADKTDRRYWECSGGKPALQRVQPVGPPVNTGAPVVILGSNLTFSTTNGTWTGATPFTFTYQWFKDGVEINNATDSTYTASTADGGADFRCDVTAMNSEDSTTAQSNAVELVFAPINTVEPAITGDTGVGDVLTCSQGTWVSYPTPPTYEYQWLRNGSPITNADTSTYTLQAIDVGEIINCEVTATNAVDFTSEKATPIAIPVPGAPVLVTAPVVTGTDIVGNLLTCSDGTWTGDPPITFES